MWILQGILRGYLSQLDLRQGVLTVMWLVDGCSTNTTNPTNPSCCNSDYFINANAWEVLNTGSALPDIAYRAVHSGPNPAFDRYDPTFKTNVSLQTITLGGDWRRSDQAYPFDLYYCRTFYTSRFADTNQTASVGGVYLFGNLPTFDYQIVSTSYQYAPTNYTTLDPQLRLLWTTDTVFTRSWSTKIFCIIVWGSNWLITLAIAWLAWTAVVGRRIIHSALYTVPITALFAVPPLRQSMPGVPGSYTIIDYIGTIPNVAIISVCTIAIILSSLMRDVAGLYSLHCPNLDMKDLESYHHRRDSSVTLVGG